MFVYLRFFRALFLLITFASPFWNQPVFAEALVTPSWYENAVLLRSEDSQQPQQPEEQPKEQKDEAIARLKADKNLESKLREALDNPALNTAALAVITTLKLEPFFKDVLKLLKTQPSWPLIEAAVVLGDSEKAHKKELTSVIRDFIEAKWGTLDSAIKPALLRAAQGISLSINPIKLLEIIKEDNYEARIESARLAGELLNENSHENKSQSTGTSEGTSDLYNKKADYHAILIAALKASPYQLRLEALTQINQLPPSELNAQFASALRGCLNDKNDDVKRTCTKIFLAANAGAK